MLMQDVCAGQICATIRLQASMAVCTLNITILETKTLYFFIVAKEEKILTVYYGPKYIVALCSKASYAGKSQRVY